LDPEDVSEHHEDVVAFAGLGTKEMIATLCSALSLAQINVYFNAMFPNMATDIRDGKPATVIQAAVRGCAARRHVQSILGASVLHRQPDPAKAARIADHLELRPDGVISVAGTQSLFLRVVANGVTTPSGGAIDASHPEVKHFAAAKLPMGDKLCRYCSLASLFIAHTSIYGNNHSQVALQVLQP